MSALQAGRAGGHRRSGQPCQACLVGFSWRGACRSGGGTAARRTLLQPCRQSHTLTRCLFTARRLAYFQRCGTQVVCACCMAELAESGVLQAGQLAAPLPARASLPVEVKAAGGGQP